MSRESIEKLRRAYEAFSRGDFDEALTFAHPNMFFPPGDAAPYRGIEKFRATRGEAQAREAAGLRE